MQASNAQKQLAASAGGAANSLSREVASVTALTTALQRLAVASGTAAASQSALAGGVAAFEGRAACGDDWLRTLQSLFGFRSFKKAVAVQGALEACAGASGCTKLDSLHGWSYTKRIRGCAACSF